MTGSADSTGGPPPGGSAVPTCYRHPDRETYIRCSRCERPICPDCMTAAPVGFQCPQCVAEGNKGVRQARTVLGGTIRETNANTITLSLLVINVGVWLLGMVMGTSGTLYGMFAREWNTNELGVQLGLVLGNPDDGFDLGVVDGQWYRLITAAFMHENALHIGMNMLALWVLGSSLEPVLGRWRFITLYLLSALGGTAASLLATSEYTLSYGASGAVFGLMGALFVIMRRLGRETGAVVGILAFNLVLGFTIQGIDWRAHLGGLVIGTGLAAVFAYAPRQQRLAWSITGCALAVMIIATVILVRVG
ncbi:rhomboid family intramembrane serine protease [Jiangella asiatica]|uniref:Rhomboid family intramembrane serine protease n=1 Tax=Jiangella asiatica TaxID=2530372 RepID=A0A4R5DFG8_9ACTN|nr:rhomboid family intramembrane serine protease [Jiangella asiatica]TDE12656.1 rhomboid family intramembrane serine protease [Jiangella asiatica]